jgi:hypothetical protein
LTYPQWLLLPVFLHFVMTFSIAVAMGRARFRGGAAGKFKRSDIINNSNGYPPDIKKIGDNFNNQFQLPVYWYACVAFVMITGTVDSMLIWLSWLFLGSRIMHAFNHIGANTLPQRYYFYLFGFVALGMMWLWFAAKYFVMS